MKLPPEIEKRTEEKYLELIAEERTCDDFSAGARSGFALGVAWCLDRLRQGTLAYQIRVNNGGAEFSAFRIENIHPADWLEAQLKDLTKDEG